MMTEGNIIFLSHICQPNIKLEWLKWNRKSYSQDTYIFLKLKCWYTNLLSDIDIIIKKVPFLDVLLNADKVFTKRLAVAPHALTRVNHAFPDSIVLHAVPPFNFNQELAE